MNSNKLYEKILEIQKKDFDKYKKDYLELKEKQKTTEAYYQGEPVPFLYTPRFFTEEELKDLETIVKKSVELFDHVVDLYMKEEKFRDLFAFPKQLEELILLGSPLERVYPMARMDIFYRGLGDFDFCEINTDGSSAMNEDRVLKELFFQSRLYKTLSEQGYIMEGFELFESWADYIFSTWDKEGFPRIGILDTDIDNDEFRRFGAHFEKRGAQVEFMTPKELDIEEDGYLSFKGKRLDYIYRRLVTSDFLKIYDELPNFVEGIKSAKTVLVGPIASQIIHNKMLFFVLHHPGAREHFTLEQIKFIENHIPFTALIDEKVASDAHFVKEKNKYLLKPTDSYASRGIYLGSDMQEGEWKATLEKLVGKEYLIQAFSDLPANKILSFEEGVKSFNHMTGLFVYNGKLKGFFSRACQGPIIASSYGGKSLATLGIKKL